MNESKNAKATKSAKKDGASAKMPAGTPYGGSNEHTLTETTDPAVPNRARTEMKKKG